MDGTEVSSQTTVNVTGFTGYRIINGYGVYCYPGDVGCWMVFSSKSGFASKHLNEFGEEHYYYTYAEALNACPPGFVLPASGHVDGLIAYMNNLSGLPGTDEFWRQMTHLLGYYDEQGNILRLGEAGIWRTIDHSAFYCSMVAMDHYVDGIGDYDAVQVRCVKQD